MNLKLILTLFHLSHVKNQQTKLNFELGNNNEPPKKNNSTDLPKRKNQDCALIPLKDMPKNKPIWDRRGY